MYTEGFSTEGADETEEIQSKISSDEETAGIVFVGSIVLVAVVVLTMWLVSLSGY